MNCRHCGAAQPSANKFCEDCGARLAAPPPKPDRVADRMESVVSPALAAISDRGVAKPRNEDRFAVADVGGAAVLVVCDGVSCSQHPDQAADAAATTIARLLRESTDDDAAALARAVLAAEAAVRAIAFDAADAVDPPETTVVAAVRRGERVTVAWVGDSRAYLVGPTSTRLLTRDHSWQNEAVDAGDLTADQAAAQPQARSLTRTVGGRDAADAPAVATATVAPGDRLVLCTDGVWDGVPDDAWPALVAGGTAVEIARRLVDHALCRGTSDNVTATVLLA